MCFMLFVGTDEPLPLKEWRTEAPDLCVRQLGEDETGVRAHFSKPLVQYVGSTAGCGCDFPHWLLLNGKEPDQPLIDVDPEQGVSNENNRRALMALLQREARGSVELYGVWAGDWAKTPLRVEQISIDQMRESSFLFGEQVFYRVQL